MPTSAPRSRYRGLGLAAVLALGCSLVAVAVAQAETLADAVALAYQTNPGLLAQRAQLRALNESYVEARSNYGPRVSASAAAYADTTTYGARDLKGDSSSESIVLTQSLFAGGRVASAVQAAEADVRAGRERLRQGEADLLQRVVNAYVAVRRDQQILAVARGTVTVLQEQLQETEAKFGVRENTRTDLAQAQARLAASRAQVFSAEAQLASSRAQYLNAVGQNPGDLAPEPDLPGVPPSIDAAFTAMESENRTLRAAKFAELGSRARVAAARAQNLPTVELRFEASKTPQALYAPSPYIQSLTAQATVTQPLFTAGQTGSGIRRALENNNSDRLTIDATRRNVVQALSQQWSLLSAARNALEADQANVLASETAFFGMRQEERFGLRSTIELLNTQQELTNAQIGLLRDRYNEYAARVAVLNLSGRLTVDILAPGVAAYDPITDFDRVKNKGALPTEEIVKVLDSLATPAPGPTLAARETTTPDQQLPLPSSPPAAADTPPLKPVTTLMDETRTPQP
ncbi:MAG TPA: TolC family outer membrane protein [Caulobacteraceae bacterium]|nr:TolC family outer membrane protein [Caulobacteraceae bacterium]